MKKLIISLLSLNVVLLLVLFYVLNTNYELTINDSNGTKYKVSQKLIYYFLNFD